MLAVIFRAQINRLYEEYHQTAKRLQELALRDYGCVEFCACTRGRPRSGHFLLGQRGADTGMAFRSRTHRRPRYGKGQVV
jgi:hypothetical protein